MVRKTLLFVSFAVLLLPGLAAAHPTLTMWPPSINPHSISIPNQGFVDPVSVDVTFTIQNTDAKDIVITGYQFSIWESNSNQFLTTAAGVTNLLITTTSNLVINDISIPAGNLNAATNMLPQSWTYLNPVLLATPSLTWHEIGGPDQTTQLKVIPAPSALILAVSGLASLVGFGRKRLGKA